MVDDRYREFLSLPVEPSKKDAADLTVENEERLLLRMPLPSFKLSHFCLTSEVGTSRERERKSISHRDILLVF